ncbi:MAG: hypothetical protein LBB51_06720 [Zoogloeaceae bacterium]|jgi:uncharacterized protein YdiU (UPF0061 family)|nr:hypothetical protein [Zoogloeaceae bacterium]
MKTKAFLENIVDMVERAFDAIQAQDFELYTVFIHIDFETPKAAKSKAVCSAGFDDLQNSLKCAKIWADSLHPKDEADRSETRTYDPQSLLLSKVETIECDDVDIEDAVSALKQFKRSSALDVAINVKAQKFNLHEEAKLIVDFEQYWFGRSIRDIVAYRLFS